MKKNRYNLKYGFFFVLVGFFKDDQSNFPLFFSHKSGISESVYKYSSEALSKHKKIDPKCQKQATIK